MTSCSFVTAAVRVSAQPQSETDSAHPTRETAALMRPGRLRKLLSAEFPQCAKNGDRNAPSDTTISPDRTASGKVTLPSSCWYAGTSNRSISQEGRGALRSRKCCFFVQRGNHQAYTPTCTLALVKRCPTSANAAKRRVKNLRSNVGLAPQFPTAVLPVGGYSAPEQSGAFSLRIRPSVTGRDAIGRCTRGSRAIP